MRVLQNLIQKFVFFSLLLCCLSASASAERVVNVVMPETAVVGGEYKGSIEISEPAPPGGTKIIIFPAHRLELPDTVIVPEGESVAEFEFEPFSTAVEELLHTQDTTVSTLYNGKIQEWPGPRVLKKGEKSRR
jgi:hypothetical protein